MFELSVFLSLSLQGTYPQLDTTIRDECYIPKSKYCGDYFIAMFDNTTQATYDVLAPFSSPDFYFFKIYFAEMCGRFFRLREK